MTSGDLFANDQSLAKKQETGPVVCLGMTFENDDARRAYFTEELRKKLQDSEFRKIEGFPIGEDDDILNLSDPPYYTACPNPWVVDLIAQWEAEKPEYPKDYNYHREPFAADISEGKNHPIYIAHSYHTKVPHRAIMRYILHYTNPGDIVFDGFCGTGMTGVAAQMCGDRDEITALGYQVKADGTILQKEAGDNGHDTWQPFSKLGARKAVMNDLSPAATFIAHNYNTPVDVAAFEQEAHRILQEVEDECGWMYETLHTDGKTKGDINYTVWSDVFLCSSCTKEVVFWEVAVDKDAGTVSDIFNCNNCNSSLKKRGLERAWESKYDDQIQEVINQAKQVPVLINYTVLGKKYEKTPDKNDLSIISKIENGNIPYWFPSQRMMVGIETRRNDRIGLTHTHHFYTKRNLWILAAIKSRCRLPQTLLWFNSQLNNVSKLNRYRPGVSFPYNPLSGTFYVGSQVSESSIFIAYKNKLKRLVTAFESVKFPNLVETRSTTCGDEIQVDYIFIDPPFGANLNYSELSSLWEQWLKVWTNNKTEAIENSAQGKGNTEYRELMTQCFIRAYKILKPGRWMTVEFSNTKASVWNSIQTALNEAGFIVANISALDKKQGSFKAVTTPTAVKQDLIISAYKPNGGFEKRFESEGQSEEGVWDFIRTHLKYLPVTKVQLGVLHTIPERDPRILFDQMISYYVRKGYSVPISSQEFQAGLAQGFIERDGMYFLPDQVAEYDRKKMLSGEVLQASLFVSDESSAIDWLRQLLKFKPQTFSDLNPQFMQQLGGWNKNEAQLDLRELLNQNFIVYDGSGLVPEQIHAYLSTNWKDMRNLPKDDSSLVEKAKDRWYMPDPNKAGDIEKLRERALLKEFEEYKDSKKKLKVFRLEAIRAGFKHAWQERKYTVIVDISNKIPVQVLEEDPKLLMWYDQALTRLDKNS